MTGEELIKLDVLSEKLNNAKHELQAFRYASQTKNRKVLTKELAVLFATKYGTWLITNTELAIQQSSRILELELLIEELKAELEVWKGE
ncbi:TPA_asm: hypothetical protein GIQ38_12175 [Listeria monocytogenes]|uniref:Uncharacterized protein n=2 Tax=Listeria TaxID=1637 RepID=A0A0E0URV1_LISMM|nr:MULTISPECIES: hypothetical protein [Listeria]ACK40929.1 hypothetical protein LMHCC_2594 [Listeria monocytogenes HCC23]AEH91076.1 hypothetical protein LMM7_0070 [Listeria monocytogenes M7]EAC4303104.1 hypothetical protein [Listeria monocytogenes]EAC5890849.1 hypothetical protein [Listeria monocytogenes]EAC6859810.1 hypothetical protein [Listeria monocytogenes]